MQMKKLVAATLFCAGLAVPAVAQGPHDGLARAVKPTAAQAADMVPVSGAEAAPVTGTPLYGGDMAIGRGEGKMPAGPTPSIAWLLALGFLGLVVLRRTRASSPY
jgi:MYXO-CTERM domain-containing protein